MSFRFRRSVKLLPGVRVNFGARGSSVTLGPRGSSVSIGKNGAYSNVGIPGTDLSYRSKIGNSTSAPSAPRNNSQSSNIVQMKASLELLEDGSIIFKDEKGNFLDDYYVIQAKKQNKETIYRWLEERCDEVNQKVDDLINIHLTTPSPDTEIIFTKARFDENPPIEPSSEFPEIMPIPPIPRKYGFFAKHIGFIKILVDKRNKKKQLIFQNLMINWQQNKNSFELEYAKKLSEYQEELRSFQKRLDNYEDLQEKRKRFIEVDRLNNHTAMQEFLEETFQSICWPRETNISFEVSNDGKNVMLDVDLPEIEDMPDKQAIVSKKDFRINFKEISETQKKKNYYTHINAIGFRIIGEVFVALPTINVVVLSAYSQRTDKKTAKIVDEYLYSIKVARDKWGGINFTNLTDLNIAECYEMFDLRRKATKTGVISPIEPF